MNQLELKQHTTRVLQYDKTMYMLGCKIYYMFNLYTYDSYTDKVYTHDYNTCKITDRDAIASMDFPFEFHDYIKENYVNVEPTEENCKHLLGLNKEVDYLLAALGFFHKELYKSEHKEVRRVVAQLTNDEDILDVLVNDEDGLVRQRVARHHILRHMLTLIHDTEPFVQIACMKSRRKDLLDILVQHPEPKIRKRMAEYSNPDTLTILLNDSEEEVRVEALKTANGEREIKYCT